MERGPGGRGEVAYIVVEHFARASPLFHLSSLHWMRACATCTIPLWTSGQDAVLTHLGRRQGASGGILAPTEHATFTNLHQEPFAKWLCLAHFWCIEYKSFHNSERSPVGASQLSERRRNFLETYRAPIVWIYFCRGFTLTFKVILQWGAIFYFWKIEGMESLLLTTVSD